MPLDDGPPDVNSTVVLTLSASTNSPPDYLLGLSRRAAVLILDSGWPRMASALLPGPAFHYNATGPNGACFHIEYTADLLHWTSICTNQVINGSIDFVDPDAPAGTPRFYRAVPEAGPPTQ